MTQPLSCLVVESSCQSLRTQERPTSHFSGWTSPCPCPEGLQDNESTVTEEQRRHYAIPLHQAAGESPVLARLVDRVQASSSRLAAIRPLLPAPLRTAVQAGPIDEGQWCLLANSNAVAAKLRQFVPALVLHLEAHGLGVSGIRIKVQGRTL